jgi:hypothetical protein
MTFEFLDFAQACEKATAYGKKHLLLGNGFSIACKPNIFAYGSLFEEAKKPYQRSWQPSSMQWKCRTSRR